MVETSGIATRQAQDRARLLAALRTGRIRQQASTIPVVDRSQPLPVSLGQQRLWFIDQITTDHSAYVIADCALVRGELDLSALRGALAFVFARHETLRTVFDVVDGVPMQQVLSAQGGESLLEVVDAGANDPKEILSDWLRRPFDLGTGPMLRAIVVRIGPDEAMVGVAVHHIATDGVSFGILVDDLVGAYAELIRGGQPEPVPPAIGYADFAAWQRDAVDGPALSGQLDYWADTLRKAPNGVDLPLDRPRPDVQSFAGGVHLISVPREVVAELKAFGAQRNLTLFVLLYTTFAALLRRWSGQHDIVIGTSLAGRGRVEFESIFGFFINNVVLRMDLADDPTWSGALDRAREVVLGAFDNQDVPFETVVDKVAPGRDLSRNPLFQIMFVLQNFAPRRLSLPGLDSTPVELSSQTSKFDLSMNWLELDDGGLLGVMEYDSALFDQSTMDRLGSHYEQLLRTAVASADLPVSRLPLLDETETEEIVRRATGAQVPIPGECLHELIEQQAQRAPDAVAARFDGVSLTYRELDQRANRLALELVGSGVRVDDRVAIVMHRSLELMVATLAVLKSGGAYVPIDPDYPAQRKLLMVAASGAAVVLTTAAATGDVPPGEHRTIVVDATVPDAFSPTPPVRPRSQDSLAYVIFTSGSTGTPKGAMVSHRAVVNRLCWMRGAFAVTPADNILQKTSYGFDVSVWELFLPLTSGATVVLAAPGAHKDPGALARLMAAEEISLVHFVPAMLAVFVDQPTLAALPALRAVVASGEALPREVRRRAEARLGVGVHNLYGPAEAAIDVTWRPPSHTHPRCPVEPLGFPIDNVHVLVLGESMTPQPVGIAGEVFIGGAGVGRGYVGSPALTAERFLPDPFGPPGSVLYRTGDRARLLDDGDIEFLGRSDHQVKVRGFRVELEEIESVLRAHPSISDAAVVASADGESLLGYAAPSSRIPVDAEPATVVDEWSDVFDDAYTAPGDDGADFSGWRSSYTRTDYTRTEMTEWMRSTVAAISELNPGNVLEIGCGTGLLLDPLLPGLTGYVGTDISPTVVARLRERYADDDRVEIRRLAADAVTDDHAFDTVVLNSVVQYFPDADYLLDVLTRAVAACTAGGTVFVGDVRSLPLYDAFRLSVLAEEATGPVPAQDILSRLAADALGERELVVDPALFARFAQAHGMVADIRFKTGVAPTEMNIFRYDVVLRPADGALLDIGALAGQRYVPGGLADQIAGCTEPEVIAGVPHPQHAVLMSTLDSVRAAEPGTLVDLSPARAARTSRDLAPGEVTRLAGELGLHAYCVPSAARNGTYDVVLSPRPVAGLRGVAGAATGKVANEPRLAVRYRLLATELREYLRDRLPEFMVPSRVIVLPELPLTPNGKTDRAALRGQAPEVRAGSEPPRGQVEQRLAALVCDLLGLGEVGREDNFFTVGGHSIMALQLVNRARAAGITLTAPMVFANPTIAAMAVASEATPAAPAKVETPAATDGADFWQRWDPRPWHTDVPSEQPYPVSPMQHEMLCAAMDKHEPGMHIAFLHVRIAGQSFDPAAFVAAWHYVMKRHSIYRTSFRWRGLPRPVLTPRQIELPPVTVLDLTDLPKAQRMARVQAALAQARTHIYDMEQAPLWYITMLRTDEDEYHGMFGTTYLLQDGWSMENVQRDLYLAYDCYRAGTEPDQPPAPDFREYVEWVARRDFSADAAYWTERMKRFAGRNQLVESIGRARVLESSDMPYEQERIEVPPEIIAPLPAMAAAHGLTVFTVLQAAWALVVSVATGSDAVTLGMVTSGRPEHLPRMDEMVGSINNILPAIMEIPSTATVAEWLREVQTDLVDLREHQYVALAQVREWGGLPWRHQLYDMHVVFENFPQVSDNFERLQLWDPQLGITQTENPIRTTMWLLDEYGLIVDMGYYRRYFDVDTIRLLLRTYRDVVLAMATSPDAPVVDVRRRFLNVFKR
jgi:amino acid adenylation domain-containing protein